MTLREIIRSGNENYGVVAAIEKPADYPTEWFYVNSLMGMLQNTGGLKTYANNVIGGEIGTITNGVISSTPLDNNEDSDYYWQNFIHSHKTFAGTGNTFGN